MIEHKKPEIFSQIFKGLAHPLRVRIVAGLIQKEECNVSTMVEKLAVSQSVVSQHLIILKNTGIVEGYRKGNQICYKVTNEEVKKIFNLIIKER